MPRRARDTVRIVLAAASLALALPRGAQAYFERLDSSSRALAFGESYVALATDASGVAWNPGAFGALARAEMQLSLSRPYFVPDLLSSTLMLGTPAFGGAMGVAWHRLGNDFIAENQWLLSYGRWVYRDDLGAGYIGGALKIGRIDVDAAAAGPSYAAVNVVSTDIGAFYQLRAGWSAGAVLRNVGEPAIEFVDGSGSTPWRRSTDIGIAYRWRPESTITGGWTNAVREREAWRAGGEIWFYDVFAVRAGLLGPEFSGGFGLKTDRWELDSSFVTHSQLGLSGRMTLVVPLGGRP